MPPRAHGGSLADVLVCGGVAVVVWRYCVMVFAPGKVLRKELTGRWRKCVYLSTRDATKSLETMPLKTKEKGAANCG